jgi:hypothetical protein
MSQENKHHHEHDHAKKRAWHRDWRTWTIVGLMIAIMFIYVFSDDESLQFGGGKPQPPVPAAAGI